MDTSETFSLRLKQWRLSHDFTQEEAGILLGIGRQYVNQIEKGRNPVGSAAAKFEMIEGLSTEALRAKLEDKRRLKKTNYPSGSPPQLMERAIEAMSPRQKLKAAREMAGLSVKQLAKKAGVQIGVLQAVEDHGATLPAKVAPLVAAVLDGYVTAEELMAGSESLRVMDEPAVMVRLPGRHPMRNVRLFSWADASAMTAIDSVDDGSFPEQQIATNVPGRAFAVEVRGDSMAPKIEAGDVVVVRADVEPRHGEIVLVRTFDGDVLCKRFSTRDDSTLGKLVVLTSINPSHAPREVSPENIAWIYPVKQLIRNNVSGL